jgi:hypothetical protein
MEHLADFPAGDNEVFKIKRFDMLYLHGWLLWSAWGILGMIQLVSVRYLKPYNLCLTRLKNFGLWLHIVSGLLILLTTLTMSMLAFRYYDWSLRIGLNLHSLLGFLVLISVGLVSILGFLSWGTLAYGKAERPPWLWRHTGFTQWMHKYMGYALLGFAQITIFMGVLKYNERSNDHRLGTANIVVFFVLWAAMEINH